MTIKIEEILDHRLREYERFNQEREYYSAIVRLAEIWNCLPALHKSSQLKWSNRINSESPSDEAVRAILSGVTDKAERLRKILSFGDRYNDDEIVLILTLRIQTEMILDLLKSNFSQGHTISMGDIDEAIKNLASSKKNRGAFIKAINQVKNNWGLPIRSNWLDAVTD